MARISLDIPETQKEAFAKYCERTGTDMTKRLKYLISRDTGIPLDDSKKPGPKPKQQ